jgi:hypothetical protein
VTKESKGLLIEQARTNLQPSSQTMQNWTYSLNVSYVSNYGIAPDGTQTADLVIPNTTNAQHYFGIPQAISPGTGTEAFSFFVKPVGTATTYNLYFRTANMNGNQSQIFDFQTGQLGTSGSSNVSQTMTSVGNGWYRCSIAYNSTKANPYPTLYFADSTNANSTTLATDGYSGFLIWGGQLEVGLHVTSYIPTSGSTITRSSDICYSVDSAFTPDGTFTAYTEASLDYDNTVANINATIFSFGPDRIQVRYDDQTGSELLVFNPSFVASLNASTPTINSGKTAVRIGQNDFKHSFSGSTPNSDAAGIFDVPETMYIGNLSNNSEFLNGHIQKIAIYPAALDDAELEALTEE